jgi:hypothetical protein
MNEPRGSRVLGALLLVVILGVIFIGLWAFLSMAFVSGGMPNGSVLFTFGALFLAAVAIATTVWLIRLVRDRTANATPAETSSGSSADQTATQQGPNI